MLLPCMRLMMLLPCLVASLALVPHAPHLGSRPATRNCAGPLACTAPPPSEAAEPLQESLFPAWPELSTKADVGDLLAAFNLR